MNHYLIVFDRSRSAILRNEAFSTPQAALQARFEAERELGRNSDIEVVVLGADSPETLKRTHSRYFRNLRQLFDNWPTEQPVTQGDGEGGSVVAELVGLLINQDDPVERAIAAQHKAPDVIAREIHEWRDFRRGMGQGRGNADRSAG